MSEKPYGLHPDWRHEHPAAYAVFVPEGVSMEFDDYAVFCDPVGARRFVEQLAEKIELTLDREATPKELTIYPLHAIAEIAK